MRRTLTLLALTLALTGCWKQSAPPLPQGEQTVTGLIEPASLSLTRRGTHVLVSGGNELYYLESSTISLATYEGRQATLTGELSYNTDQKDLPVLVVTAVDSANTGMRTWDIDAMELSIDMPREWKGKIVTDQAQFTASGSASPILTLFREGRDALQNSSSSTRGVDLSTLRIGMRSAIRIRNNETGREKVQIDLGAQSADPDSSVLTILFTPSDERTNDPEAWDTLTTDILRSIRIKGESSSGRLSSSYSSASLPPVTGSGAGMPCGGVAGILCPAGFYCNVTDLQENSGRCVGM
ncbi:MAG: hypothetical protein WCS85_00960 [Candidatus Peribacteraceae bacterium]|jgi:hypothetical protein